MQDASAARLTAACPDASRWAQGTLRRGRHIRWRTTICSSKSASIKPPSKPH